MAHVRGILADENNHWIFLHNDNVICFGNLQIGNNLFCSEDKTLLHYSSEDELEDSVNNFTGETDYYKEQAQDPYSEVYIGESEKYPVIIPDE